MRNHRALLTNPAASRLAAWIVGAFPVVGLVIVASLFWASLRILLIEPELAQQTMVRDVVVGVPTVVVMSIATIHATRRMRNLPFASVIHDLKGRL